MKSNLLSGGGSAKSAILLAALLLSACATGQHVGVTDAQPAHQSVAAPQPAAPQKAPAPAEAQQPALGAQGDSAPKKPKHNVEED